MVTQLSAGHVRRCVRPDIEAFYRHFANQFFNNSWKQRSCQGDICYVSPWWRAKKQHRMWPDVDVYVFVHHRREIRDQPSYQVRCPHHFKNL